MAGETGETAIRLTELEAPASAGRSRIKDPGFRRMAAAGAAILGALLLLIVLRAFLGSGDDHDRKGAHILGHKDMLTRTVFRGEALSEGVRIRVNSAIELAKDDPKSKWSVIPAIPVGEKVLLTFKLNDNRTGEPVSGKTPVIRANPQGLPSSLQEQMTDRELALERTDLFVLDLGSGNLGVIDSFAGHHSAAPGVRLGQKTGASYAASVGLGIQTPGEMVSDPSQRYLLATNTEKGEVAVVDTFGRKLLYRVRVGKAPYHIAIQPDARHFWVGNDASGSVSILDGKSHEPRGVKTGRGHHEIAFTPDSRYAFVSNGGSDTVTVLDARTGKRQAEVRVGGSPHGLDYSLETKTLYVANEGAGTVSLIRQSEKGWENAGPDIKTGKGTVTVRVAPDGKTAFAVNRGANSVSVIDLPESKVATTVATGKRPDSLVFFGDWAIVRNTMSADVTFINVEKPDTSGELEVGREPMYTKAETPGHAPLHLSPLGDQVLVPEPVSGQVFAIQSMNGRPMIVGQTKADVGAFAAAVISNRMRETAPGTYQRVVRFDRPATYRMEVAVPGQSKPAVFHLKVVSAQDIKPFIAQPVPGDTKLVAGKSAVVRFKVTDRQSGAAVAGIEDGVIQAYRYEPGKPVWQRYQLAKLAGKGIYEAKFTFPDAGNFSISFRSVSKEIAGPDNLRKIEVVAPAARQ